MTSAFARAGGHLPARLGFTAEAPGTSEKGGT